MEWEIIDTGEKSAEENMRFDAELLENLDRYARPIIHFYEWEGRSATYGYFIDPAQCLQLDGVKRHGISLARRPTGGGVVFHFWDMAFSVLVPAVCPEFSENTLDNYAFVNSAVLAAVKEFAKGTPPLSLTLEDLASLDESCRHFCMAKPTKYDVLWEGRKVAGAAQRKTRKGFLHQGTIALCMPEKELLTEILPTGVQVGEAMQLHTAALLGRCPKEADLVRAKAELRPLLATHLSRASSILNEIN